MKRRTHQEELESLCTADEAETFDRPERKRAIIIFTPRSGSSWLADLLKSTGVFGFPNEYVNQYFFSLTPFKVRTERDYLNAIELHTATENKFCCLEATWGEIEQFSTLDFFAFYKDATFFHLRRRDIISQAISSVIATQTGLFHRVNGSNITMKGPSEEVDILSLPNLSTLIQQWCSQIAYCEWMAEYSFMLKNIRATRIFYEDIVRDPAGITRDILSTAGLEPVESIESAFEKLDRPQTALIKELFLKERPEFLNRLMQMRAPLSFSEEDSV